MFTIYNDIYKVKDIRNLNKLPICIEMKWNIWYFGNSILFFPHAPLPHFVCQNHIYFFHYKFLAENKFHSMFFLTLTLARDLYFFSSAVYIWNIIFIDFFWTNFVTLQQSAFNGRALIYNIFVNLNKRLSLSIDN